METRINYKGIISASWLGMALLLMMMQITDLIEAGMNSDFSDFNSHLRMSGLWLISVMIIINIIVQVSIFIFDNKAFYWGVFSVSIIYTVFMIYHQISHLVGGDKFDIHFTFDILHHTLGICAIYFSYKLAKTVAHVEEHKRTVLVEAQGDGSLKQRPAS